MFKPEKKPDAEPAIGDSVYHSMKDWIAKPSLTRVGSYSKIQAASNEVRQILFTRQLKAEKKYGSGVKLSDNLPGMAKAAEKLADAAFFVYHAFHNGDGNINNHFLLVQNLHTLINNLFIDYRAKGATKEKVPKEELEPGERHNWPT